MTDTDLKDQLKALQVPRYDPIEEGRALHRARVAFAQPREQEESLRPRRLFYRGWVAISAGLAVAALVVGGLATSRRHLSPAAELHTLAEMQAIFPDQFNALIDDNGTVQLDLTTPSLAGEGTHQPLQVVLEADHHRVSILSYSGRSITLKLQGASVTFEALVTAEGGVVLQGNQFAWSSAQPSLLAGYRVEARPITAAL